MASALGRQKPPGDGGGRRLDWSSLPDLPLGCIVRRLPTLMDFFSFRCVCTSWRSVGRDMEGDFVASHPPLLFEHSLNRFYHLAEKKVYKRSGAAPPSAMEAGSVVGSSHGHLILARDRRPWLLNPLTGAEIHGFPKARLLFSWALLSSPPTSPGCVLVAYDSQGIQCCRPGDEQWRVVYQSQAGSSPHKVKSVAIAGEKAYVMMDGQGLAAIDFTGHGHPELAILNAEALPQARLGWCSFLAFLAESRGELFAFCPERLYDPGEFGVSWFNCSSCKWVRSEGLGGRAVFVNHWRGFIFVDYAKWGGHWDRVYVFSSGLRHVSEYKMKDEKSKLFLFSTKDLVADGFTGVWVLPSLS